MSQFSFDIQGNLTVDDVVDMFMYRVVVGSDAGAQHVYEFPIVNFKRALEFYARRRLVTKVMPAGSRVSLDLVSKDVPMFFVTLFEYVR